jgi:hypothetical protein
VAGAVTDCLPRPSRWCSALWPGSPLRRPTATPPRTGMRAPGRARP